MGEKRLTRRQAIIRRRIFLSVVVFALVLVISLVVFVIASVTGGSDEESKSGSSNTSDMASENTSSDNQSGVSGEVSGIVSSTTSPKPENPSSNTSSDKPAETAPNGVKLDANFGNLMLVNGENPLPDSYDSEVRKDLVEIDKQYRNNDNVTQIHKDVYPYITAMVAAAQKDGVDLRVWSPFRSYAIQNDLFQKQVNRVGGDEAKAATVVARPGTSEHNTGLCADFNMASDAFENTEMYRWMCENAEDYGFIMRYRKDKQPITGVIHESWHWRFVGINHAKQINKLDMCLEEYVEYLENAKDNSAEKIID